MDKGRVSLKSKASKPGVSGREQEASYKTGVQLLEERQGASQSNGGRNQQFHSQQEESDLLSNMFSGCSLVLRESSVYQPFP